jgi:hypothetical protein
MCAVQRPTRDDVIAQAKQQFPSEDTDVIMATLDEYGRDPFEQERERVQMDILKLSRGDIDRLHVYVRAAKTDFRDVIGMAEYQRW